MPGISTFSKEDLAEMLFAAVKEEAAAVRVMKEALEEIASFEEIVKKECTPDDVAFECIAIAKSILKKVSDKLEER